MSFDNYMNPMFSDMDNKYIYPMPYVNPMIYMNPYMMNSMPYQINKNQNNTERQTEQYTNTSQYNPMMYMNPYMMNPMMGGIDPSMLMQMYMQMVQIMQMMGCVPNMNPMNNINPMNNMGIDPTMMQDSMNNGYPDPMKQMPGMPMMGGMPGMPMMGGMPGMPNINIEEFDEEEM